MKGSMYPLMMDDFWMGMMIRVIRLIQGMSWMMAASSISPESWSMELSELRLAKGMYLMVPTMISRLYVLKRFTCSLENKMKKAAPTAMEGIR